MGAMDPQLTRRRLLWTALAGVPIVAACGDDKPATPPQAAPLQPTPAAPAQAAAGGTEAAVPQAAESPSAAQPESATAAEAPAAPRVRTIILDPGHGGEEIGAASAIQGYPNLLEKDSNLAFSFRLRELLEADGFRVVMTRESDSRAFGWVRPNPAAATPGPNGEAPNPTILTSRSDLQARVDWANNSQGDLFLSLHSNDAGDISENGVEVWYCADREDGAANEVLAQMLLGNVLDGLRAFGYRANNRGIKEDRYFRVRNGRNFHLFVLGPRNPDANHPRATMMPAALIENLFMRHARDQYVLRDPAAREAITQSMRLALNQFFEWRGG
jgi:N-acetylmuramoyl-L-alanine amidase